jgi:hypothetical protein
VVPLAFLALTCVLTYVLAARLYGRTAGTFAVWLTALNANLLGHGSLVTPDIIFTAAGGYTAYMDGHQSQTGFFDYYIRGLLYKTPLLTLGLVLLAAFAGGRIRRREVPMVLVGAGIFAAFSLLRTKNIGIRYVLFLYPLMHVWIGRLLADGCAVGRLVGRRTITAAVVLGIAAAISSELTIWPHHLAYFSTLAGGPSAGPTHLLDSNVDWGQDLILLKRFMQEKGIETIDLACFGRVDPVVYGIRYRTLDAASHGRWAAVSVNFIYGRSYFINGSQLWADAGEYRRFQSVPPQSRLGYSLYVFDLGTDAATR